VRVKDLTQQHGEQQQDVCQQAVAVVSLGNGEDQEGHKHQYDGRHDCQQCKVRPANAVTQPLPHALPDMLRKKKKKSHHQPCQTDRMDTTCVKEHRATQQANGHPDCLIRPSRAQYVGRGTSNCQRVQ